MSIDCTDCGKCCSQMGYPPFIPIVDIDEEFAALSVETREEILSAVRLKRGDLQLPCIWLDEETKQCKHYDLRPWICRDFKIGSQECIDWRNHV